MLMMLVWWCLQGAWACFDEFNRIDIEVLSVIAQQLLVLREGRIMGKTEINFMGVQIALKDHHVIITMNPGYAGRTELPDNLQVCFRPVAMMVPNYALIAEIMLFAEGFGDAKTLSRKMCKLYILCSEQLSQQPHYDYGLRAVKSVLVMAGSLKRANPDVAEDLVLIRALRDSNVPKFLADDLPLFAAIVQDLFPGVEIPNNDYGEFQVGRWRRHGQTAYWCCWWVTDRQWLTRIVCLLGVSCSTGGAGGGADHARAAEGASLHGQGHPALRYLQHPLRRHAGRAHGCRQEHVLPHAGWHHEQPAQQRLQVRTLPGTTHRVHAVLSRRGAATDGSAVCCFSTCGSRS